MTWRGGLIGLLVGAFVAATTYFNDQLIRQTMMIGNHLAPVVFALVAVLLFGLNPLLRALSPRAPLRPGEIAVIAAIALAACGWPGNSLYRVFSAVVTLPGHRVGAEPSWIAADVMSFTPGGSGELAIEHVPDAPGLARVLLDAADDLDAAPTPAGRIWRLLDDAGRERVRLLAKQERPTQRERRAFVDSLNRVLVHPGLYDPRVFAQTPEPLPDDLVRRLQHGGEGRLDEYQQVQVNRRLLAAALPAWILPAPRGEGALLEGGRPAGPAQELLLAGVAPDAEPLGVLDLPWRAWWPTLLLWCGAALCMGLAALCLALIVHPQWSMRELLPYPIPRFLVELSRTEPGDWLPAVARRRGFWIALGAIVALHLVNGLHAYFPDVPEIPLRFNFNPMRELFPNLSRVFGSHAYFRPRIYPAMVAFALFLGTSVSFSLGVSQLLLMILGAFLLSRGISFDRDYMGGSRMNMMAFGAFAASFLVIVYVGRRYYLNVAAAMVGLARCPDTPAYAPPAGWGAILGLTGAAFLLHRGGLPAPLAGAMVLLLMLMWLVMSRISAETGLFLQKTNWLPVGIITSLVGFEAVGPSAYVVLALCCAVLAGESRETIMPFLVNGLRLAQHADPRRLARTSRWMGVMIVLSLVVAGVATLTLQHNHGLDMKDTFVTRLLAPLPFNELAGHVTTARAEQSLDASVTTRGLQRLSLVSPEPGALPWAALGGALFLLTAAARLRLPWWPLHPVAFLVWGSWPMFVLSFSLLLGWLIKLAIVSVDGVRGYRAAVPLAVGVILGDILSSVGWSFVGAAYYFHTGFTPPAHHVFPY